MQNFSTVPNDRVPDHPCDPLFPGRWSPRAMSGEPISDDELMILFEAARWAPSSMNNQPWRFVYARRDTPHWETLFGLLSEGNKSWCVNAAVLCVVVSKDTFDRSGKSSRTHSYSTGAAWMSLALQTTMRDLVVHGMQGFSYDRAREELGVPEGYTVEAMFAVGRPGDPADLPESKQGQEHPSGRKPITETVFEGRFGDDGTSSSPSS